MENMRTIYPYTILKNEVLQDVSLWTQTEKLSLCSNFLKYKSMHNKTTEIKFRCTPIEKIIIQEKAKASGKALSEYCRQQAIRGEVKATPQLTEMQQGFFRTLKQHNMNFALLSNYIKHRDTQLYNAIWEHLTLSKDLYKYFF